MIRTRTHNLPALSPACDPRTESAYPEKDNLFLLLLVYLCWAAVRVIAWFRLSPVAPKGARR